MIYSKEIGWIVFLLDRGQARKVGAESTVNDLFGFDVERRKKCAFAEKGRSTSSPARAQSRWARVSSGSVH